MKHFAAKALLTLLMPAPLFALEFSEIGLRGSVDQEDDASIWGAKAYTMLDPGWEKHLGEAFFLDLDLEFSGGALVGDDETAALAHAGPSLVFGKLDVPISIAISTGLTLISEDELEDDYDLGGNIQFTSAIGVIWQINKRVNISYRFEHMSNAGLESENPGLDMHAFSIGYSF